LASARREESLAERQLAKARQAQTTAQEQAFSTDAQRTIAEQGLSVTAGNFSQAGEALADAEKELLTILVNLESKVASFDLASAAREDSTVVVLAGPMNSAKKVLDRIRKAFEAAQASYSQFASTFAEAIAADTRLQEAQADVAIASKCRDVVGGISAAAASTSLKGAERELARVEKALEKAQERARVAHECDASELREAMSALADSMRGAGEVKTAQQDLKTCVRNLISAFQRLKTSSEARSKAYALQRKSAKSASACSASCRQAKAWQTMVDGDCTRLVEAVDSARARRIACETEVERLRNKTVEMETEEANCKRKRDELKTSLCEAKSKVKCARIAEKDSASGRDATYKHFARAGNEMKDELAVVKTSAEDEQKAISAVQALKAEAYDANQVVEAYEAKKRPRLEGET
jgi:hypothetical protein